MRLPLLPVLLISSCFIPQDLGAQEKGLNPRALPEFLARYTQGLKPLDGIYAELKDEDLSKLDERGQPLARRHIEDRLHALDDLRKSVRELDSSPQDLVVAIHLLLQSEALSDDLFDLSQVAYDDDREELGKRITDLLSTMDHHNALLESYVLNLAAERQEHIRVLENENAELRRKLHEAGEKPRTKASRFPVEGQPHSSP